MQTVVAATVRTCIRDVPDSDLCQVSVILTAIFRRVRKIAKSDFQLRHDRVSFRTKKLTPTGWILMKIDI